MNHMPACCNKTIFTFLFCTQILLPLSGCAYYSSNQPSSSEMKLENPKPTKTFGTTPTREITPTPEFVPIPLFMDPIVPPQVSKEIKIPDSYTRSSEEEAPVQFSEVPSGGNVLRVYVIAVPFFTTRDTITSREIMDAWNGKNSSMMIHISQEDIGLFSRRWGDPSKNSVIIMEPEGSPQVTPEDPLVVSILPFDELNPRWKVLSLDGFSPLEKYFSATEYPLTVQFGFTGDAAAVQKLTAINPVPISNYDINQMTTLVMTGTTALVRATANKMDTKGITYPAEKVKEILSSADITHISNEVSFTPDCPPGNPFQGSMIFCSRPEYLDLLKEVGTDVVELTGNHNLDWGFKPYLLSLDLYKEAGIRVYGGGIDAEVAREPVIFNHHGNQIAFLGCNYAGPASAQASVNSPGAAACDYAYLDAEIKRLRREGIIPVVTVQHAEYYHMLLSENQVREFKQLSNAGAAIVQGSQSHFPQPKAFTSQGFIDYGPGNLFFDQMDRPVQGTRNEFITRYTFYRGNLLSIELTTWILEDYAQPREMTSEERSEFLKMVFDASQAAMAEYP